MKALNYLEDVNRAYSKANKLTRKKKRKKEIASMFKGY